MPTQRYTYVRCNGDAYYIPLNKLNEWNEWPNTEAYELGEIPDWAEYVDPGHTLTFENPEICLWGGILR